MKKNEAYSFLKVDFPNDPIVTYSFITENGVLYNAYFNPSEYDKYLAFFPALLHHSFGFVFFRENERPRYKDARVLSTIHDIVIDFFSTQADNVVILYHCQIGIRGLIQAARAKMFDDAYEASEFKSIIHNKHLEVEIFVNHKKVPYYIGLFTKKSNPNLNEVYFKMDGFAVEISNGAINK